MRSIWENPQKAQEAVEEAKAYIREQKAPLTIERLAASLGVSRSELNRRLGESGGSPAQQKVRVLLKKACAEAVASVVEFGLLKGNSPTMPIFYLKSNGGYGAGENEEGEVHITGEEDLE